MKPVQSIITEVTDLSLLLPVEKSPSVFYHLHESLYFKYLCFSILDTKGNHVKPKLLFNDSTRTRKCQRFLNMVSDNWTHLDIINELPD